MKGILKIPFKLYNSRGVNRKNILWIKWSFHLAFGVFKNFMEVQEELFKFNSSHYFFMHPIYFYVHFSGDG